MDDGIDYDEILAEAEQEGNMYDDYEDDIEAEMAMEAESQQGLHMDSWRAKESPTVYKTDRNASRQWDSPARSTSCASTRTPTTGRSASIQGVGAGPAAAAAAAAVAASMAEGPIMASRRKVSSPEPLEERLGVSPQKDGDSPAASALTLSEARRALNSDGLSPLHPVLRDNSNSRWGASRLVTVDEIATVAGRRTRPYQKVASASSTAATNIFGRSSRSSGRGYAPRVVKTEGKVLSRPSIDNDTVPFMKSGGRMMHLRLRRSDQASLSSARPSTGGLLRSPFAALLERVTERRVWERSLASAAAEREVAAADEAAETGLGEGMEVDEEDGPVSRTGHEGRSVTAKRPAGASGKLWVDKYAPEAFRDLLSDERVNREVLRAIKAWDPFVFKKQSTDKGSTASKRPSAYPITPEAEGDPGDARPDARVTMLCGPPGLGKTTLAHVVARHAGYRVYEINASDDRSASVLRQRITEAMERNTLLTDKRPSLIILDEVDGADGKAAAQVLVDIATAPLARASGGSGGGKRKSRRTALTRPLILICNDQWTPALRPIRALAQVFVFRTRASPARLVQRLKAICTSEGLSVNTDALTRLADRSHLDVRSCLNTLQFVARKAAAGKVRNASSALLTAVAEGIKDERRDLFEVLRSVFTRKKSGTKRRLFVGGDQGSPELHVADARKADVLEEVTAFNDHGKVLAGVHENFLAVRFNDPTLSKASAALDWLEMADLMETRVNQSQDYSFSRYCPVAAAGIHFLCRSDQRVAVSQPKKEYEVRTMRATKSNILHCFADGRQLGSSGRTTEAIVLDMLSHLMDILAPTLRPINPDLLSAQERARFRGLVGVLLSCGLTFAPQSAATASGRRGGNSYDSKGAENGQMPSRSGLFGNDAQEYTLEPAIDQLLRYEGYDFAHPTLAAPLRPMVAHEISLEAMRQAEASKRTDQRTDAADADSSRDVPSPAEIETPHSDTNPVAAMWKGSTAKQMLPLPKKTATVLVSHGRQPDSEGTSVKHQEKCPPREGEYVKKATAGDDARSDRQAPSPERIQKDASRPAHVVPFWNRTNWKPGRKDGTGARGSVVGTKTAGTKGEGDVPSKRRAVDSAGVAAKPAGAGGLGGRGTTEDKRARVDEGGEKSDKKSTVRYQFRAGYTNAVRRPVRIRDLL